MNSVTDCWLFISTTGLTRSLGPVGECYEHLEHKQEMSIESSTLLAQD